LSLNYYSDNFYTWKRVDATELKVETTELRDKFRVYKSLIFQPMAAFSTEISLVSDLR